MIKLDTETIEKEIYDPEQKNVEYNEARDKLIEVLEQFSNKEALKIDSAVGNLETIVTKTMYTKGFHNGMRFILEAMAGKEVISL